MSDQPIPQQEVDPVRGLVEALEPFVHWNDTIGHEPDDKVILQWVFGDRTYFEIAAQDFRRAATAIRTYRAWEEGGGSDSAAAPGRSGASAPPEGWRPIESAPKSTSRDVGMAPDPLTGEPIMLKDVRGIYLLGFCPEEGADPAGCIDVIWWEPNAHGDNKGAWVANVGDVHPTHWAYLPAPPGSSPAPPPPAGAPPEGWRCFHCDFVTSDRDEARKHFGPTSAWGAWCQERSSDLEKMRDEVTRTDERNHLLFRQKSNLEAALLRLGHKDEVDAAYAAAAAPPPPASAPPEGWRLVPVEPTRDMMNACAEILQWHDGGKIYRAMLAAAPPPPAGVDRPETEGEPQPEGPPAMGVEEVARAMAEADGWVFDALEDGDANDPKGRHGFRDTYGDPTKAMFLAFASIALSPQPVPDRGEEGVG